MQKTAHWPLLGGHLAACLSPRPALGELIGRPTPWSAGAPGRSAHTHTLPPPKTLGIRRRQVRPDRQLGECRARGAPSPVPPSSQQCLASSNPPTCRPLSQFVHVTFPGTGSLAAIQPLRPLGLVQCRDGGLAFMIRTGRNWCCFQSGGFDWASNQCTKSSRPSGLRRWPCRVLPSGPRHCSQTQFHEEVEWIACFLLVTTRIHCGTTNSSRLGSVA